MALNQIKRNMKPSIKTSWIRKLQGNCIDYEEDFELFSLLYDIHLAKSISSVVNVAQKHQIAPEQAASDMQNFDAFWAKELEKLEDICRQQSDSPNLFLTVAPAEWTFNYNRGVKHWRQVTGSLSEGQAIMTLHMNHVVGTILQELLLRKGDPFLSTPEFTWHPHMDSSLAEGPASSSEPKASAVPVASGTVGGAHSGQEQDAELTGSITRTFRVFQGCLQEWDTSSQEWLSTNAAYIDGSWCFATPGERLFKDKNFKHFQTTL